MDAAAAAGRLALQHCTACGAGQYPPRELCWSCLSDALDWTVSNAASGTVLAQGALHHSNDPAVRQALPLRLGLVRIDPDRIVLCLLDVNAAPGDVVPVRAGLDAEGRTVLTAGRQTE